MKGRGATALMASVDHKNLILMECLLRQGARMNIRDHEGFSPCHYAILVGDLKCLEKLVEFGGASVVASKRKRGKGDVHSLFQTAVENDHPEIVSYLLSNKEFKVDVKEKTVYKIYKDATYLSDASNVKKLTPQERAIVELLVKEPGIKIPGIKELESCLLEGHTELALVILDYIPANALIPHQVQNKCPLHCLQSRAFWDESEVNFTKKLILEFVRRGWNVNCGRGSNLKASFMEIDVWTGVGGWLTVSLSRCTLLHQACISNAELKVIKALVEVTGADLNCKTEGSMELTPLQILIMKKEWRAAGYLIEKRADLNVRGRFNYWTLARFVRKLPLEDQNSFNAVEFLVRMGCEEGLPVLEQVLVRPDFVWNGANEFFMAVEGANLVYISKILEHCPRLISKEELNWVSLRKAIGGIPDKVPTLLYLLGTIIDKDGRRGYFVDVPVLAHLISIFVSLGYDPNLPRERSFCTTLETEGILGFILKLDFRENSSNLLLRTILQVDHFRLNGPEFQGNPQWKGVRFDSGINPVDFVVRLLSRRCKSEYPFCWKNKPLPPPTVEAIKLLISHGLDVNGMVIDAQFSYHFGFKGVLKMLYCAGAHFSDKFFTFPRARVCHAGHPDMEELVQEIEDVKQWKHDFDRNVKFSLNHLSRLQVRKTMKCVGDLKMLDGIPKLLKDYILCKTFF